jgi:Peptidase family M28
MEIIRELCSFEGRLAGSDAERRAANRMAERLRGTGRRVEVEPVHVHPQTALVYAAHCVLGVAGSLVAVGVPVLGFALVLFAATSLYLDLNARLYLLRRIFFRRASQNVVSRGANPNAPARLLVVAHIDAAKTGFMYGARRIRLLSRFPISPTRLIFWSIACLVPVLALRAAGIDSGPISLLQLPPTLILLVALFAFVDIELSDVVPGANDNASGVAVAVSLAEELAADRPANLDVWVVLTGGGESPMQGMRSFIRGERKNLDVGQTYVVDFDAVGRGDVRFVTGEGSAVTYELGSRLTELCRAIADADAEQENRFRAAAVRRGTSSEALPARLAGCPSTTITCLEPGAVVPANYRRPEDVPDEIDPDAVDRAHDFALALIRQLDRDLGRSRAPALGASA